MKQTLVDLAAGPHGRSSMGFRIRTSPGGSPFAIGQFGDGTDLQPGFYSIVARIGNERLGGVEFEVIN
ncbi:MAG: hypothetical protein WEA61_05885 [Anaerolineales bacterium]